MSTALLPTGLHGLNAVYLMDYGWYRVDPRGIRTDISAQFEPPRERLPFTPGSPPDPLRIPISVQVALVRLQRGREARRNDAPCRQNHRTRIQEVATMLVGCWPLHVIDDEDFDRSAGGFELQP
jgi:hypothetical protein